MSPDNRRKRWPGGSVASMLGLVSAVLGIIGFGFFVYDRYVNPRASMDPQEIEKLASIIFAKAQAGGPAFGKRRAAGKQELGDLEAAINSLQSDQEPGYRKALEKLKSGDTTAAERLFTQAAESRLKAAVEAKKRASDAYRHLGALAFLKDTSKAIAAYRKAAELDPANPTSWNRLGHLLKRSGDLDAAKGAYGTVLSIAEKTKSRKWEAIATGNLGLIYQKLNKFDRAEKMQRKGLAIEVSLGRKKGISAGYANLGKLYAMRGKYDEAEEMFKKALDIANEQHNKGHAAVLAGNLGGIALVRRDYEMASKMYTESLNAHTELGDLAGEAFATGNLAIVAKRRGDLVKAAALHAKALAISKKVSWKDGIARNLKSLGYIAKQQNKIARACENWGQALELYHEMGIDKTVVSLERRMRKTNCPSQSSK